MSTSINSELKSLISRLEHVENSLSKQLFNFEDKENKWSKINNNIKLFLKNDKSQLINLNVGGIKLRTSINTLLSDKDSIFNDLLSRNNFNIDNVLIINRDGDIFKIILNYLRTFTFNYEKYDKETLLKIKSEAEYYNIKYLYNLIFDLFQPIKIINYEHSGDYAFKGKLAGTQKVEDLDDINNLETGICTNAPGEITFELENISEIVKVSAIGFYGDSNLWYPLNGSGSTILGSIDKENWKYLGKLSFQKDKQVKDIVLKDSINAKYIRFKNSTYLGFGYLKFHKKEIN